MTISSTLTAVQQHLKDNNFYSHECDIPGYLRLNQDPYNHFINHDTENQIININTYWANNVLKPRTRNLTIPVSDPDLLTKIVNYLK